MSNSLKADTLPLLEKILTTKGLKTKIETMIESRDNKIDEFGQYLESIGNDTPSYHIIYEILKGDSSAACSAGFCGDALRYAAEYSLKYLVNRCKYGKESGTSTTSEDMYLYVIRRLVKNKHIAAEQVDSADLPADLPTDK